METKEIYTEKLIAGKRTYLLELKLTAEGRKYLTITENQQIINGEIRTSRIMVFEENLSHFYESIVNVFGKIGIKNESKNSYMEEMKDKYHNAYSPWTKEDDEKLEQLFCEGKVTSYLAKVFERNEGAINSRIKKLELREKYR